MENDFKEEIEQLEVQHEQATHKRGLSSYIVWVNLWSTLGAWTYGYSISIISSSLAQPTFISYFDEADTRNVAGIIGAVASLFNVGGFIGFFVFSWLADKYGRKSAFLGAAICSIIGQALSGGAASNWGMLIFARFMTGFGGWPSAMAAVIYQSEISITETRGFLSGTVGWMIAVAYAVSAWVGVGVYYGTANTVWRIPLLIGIIFPVLTIVFLPMVPESPRWLASKGRYEEAMEILKKMHASSSDPHHLYARQDYEQIHAQAELDKKLDGSWKALFTKPGYLKRVLMVILASTTMQCSGIQAITNFGPTLYAGLGYGPADQLLFSAGWITIAPIESLIMMFIVDRFGRKIMITLAPLFSALALIIEAVLVKEFANSDNQAGKGAAVAFIFIFIAGYLFTEVATYVFIGEIFPTHLRAKGVTVALATIAANAVWVAEGTPTGIAQLGWKFNFVYAGLSVGCCALCAYFIPETKMIPLEEIAAIFGEDDEIAVHESDHRLTREVTGETSNTSIDASLTKMA
ncbi:general substrate transporter [Calocera viscosa TUFC12733]|uniref:General substrate transporter n=1 Tax=Calocera viscosa (strain TUFC12733) TaxID=1330018 RepID=A0A167HBM5_CALVF|nr:general substrate transporter [Calocera viscosa TUFC12733]